jgi:NADPH:quinone reductase-like Zn-dependent oxidoreductase
MDVPDPVGHEVLVRNTVIGLNFVDIYYRRGTLPVPVACPISCTSGRISVAQRA